MALERGRDRLGLAGTKMFEAEDPAQLIGGMHGTGDHTAEGGRSCVAGRRAARFRRPQAAQEAARTGSAASKACLPLAASVPGRGYSPEKHASQWSSREPPIASYTPSSER
jgi:hypothetical protein